MSVPGNFLGQPLAQDGAELRHRRFLVLQRHGQVAVLRADGGRGDEGLVERAERQAAVVDNTLDLAGQQALDLAIDQHGDLACLRDLGAHGRAHVNGQRVGIDLGKKSCPANSSSPSEANAEMPKIGTKRPRMSSRCSSSAL